MRALALALPLGLALAALPAEGAAKTSTIHGLVTVDEAKAMFHVAEAAYAKDDITEDESEDGKAYSQTYIDLKQTADAGSPHGTAFISLDWGVTAAQAKADFKAMVDEWKKDGRKPKAVAGLGDEAVYYAATVPGEDGKEEADGVLTVRLADRDVQIEVTSATGLPTDEAALTTAMKPLLARVAAVATLPKVSAD